MKAKKADEKARKTAQGLRFVGFYVPADVHKRFRAYCLERETTASDALRGAVQTMIREGK